MAKNFGELLKPRMTGGRIDLNWEDVPEGEWTEDLQRIIRYPRDRELASIAVIAYKNLAQRVSGQKEPVVKYAEIGVGFGQSIWYPEHDEDKWAEHVGQIAVLIANFGIPDNYVSLVESKTEADQHLDDWLPIKNFIE